MITYTKVFRLPKPNHKTPIKNRKSNNANTTAEKQNDNENSKHLWILILNQSFYFDRSASPNKRLHQIASHQ